MRSLIKSGIIVSAVSLMSVASANADLQVRFSEGAPKDRFSFTNIGNCPLENANLLLDLKQSKAGLIFDVTERGAGVEVYQPLEFVSGFDRLQTIPSVVDGDNQLSLAISQLNPGETIAFTIDLDDTLGTQATMVSDSEITGVEVTVTQQGETHSSSFAQTSDMVVELRACGNV